MAQPTAYPPNSLLTGTATEQAFTIKGSYKSTEPITLAITLKSGTVQFAVADQQAVNSPVIDVGLTHASWSTAGDKILLTFDPVAEEIRFKGVSTFAVNW